MKNILILAVVVFSFTNVFSQATSADLQKLVDTEKSFARTAAEKNTKDAFLEFLADDGITFNPNPGNGKKAWTQRNNPPGLLAWTPEYADISSNGLLGYTTGPWEYHPQGKDAAPTAFGHFVTLWQKQPDGNFKFALDIGISHDQSAVSGVNAAFPSKTGKELNEKKYSAADSSTVFFETAESQGLSKAYKMFAADDLRLYREGKKPFIGKKNALEALKNDKSSIKFAKRSIFFSAADLAYLSNSYTLSDKDGNPTEKGYFLQIWKLRNGKWVLVLDLFDPLPPEKKS